MAISVLVAVDPVADELVPLIASRMAGLRTGDGRRGCDMGPLVTGEHRDKVASYVAAGVASGQASQAGDVTAGTLGYPLDSTLVYPVLLFREDMTGLYVTVAQGTQELKQQGRAHMLKQLETEATRVRNLAAPDLAERSFIATKQIQLGTGNLARDYAASFTTLIASAKRGDAGAYGLRPILELRLGDRK